MRIGDDECGVALSKYFIDTVVSRGTVRFIPTAPAADTRQQSILPCCGTVVHCLAFRHRIPERGSMIIDTLANFHRYLTIHSLFPGVSEFIHGRDLGELDIGKYPLGRNITAGVSEYVTAAPGDRYGECHRRFIDIQVMIAGVEAIGVCPVERCRPAAPYDPEKDYGKLTGAMDFITLRENDVAVFFPHDGHMPGIAAAAGPCRVRKMVVKVPVNP
jgi:YhcH/YjgK/YiaL family protein